MKLNWNEQLASAVRIHLEKLLQCPEGRSDEIMLVADRANALPVYSDLGGTLAISPDGAVLFYNSESGEIRPETDHRWVIVAAVSAAERYPEMASMLPDRPMAATVCSSCSGTGKVLAINAGCGKCWGLGWVRSC